MIVEGISVERFVSVVANVAFETTETFGGAAGAGWGAAGLVIFPDGGELRAARVGIDDFLGFDPAVELIFPSGFDVRDDSPGSGGGGTLLDGAAMDADAWNGFALGEGFLPKGFKICAIEPAFLEDQIAVWILGLFIARDGVADESAVHAEALCALFRDEGNGGGAERSASDVFVGDGEGVGVEGEQGWIGGGDFKGGGAGAH